jgi:hypothetical protein
MKVGCTLEVASYSLPKKKQGIQSQLDFREGILFLQKGWNGSLSIYEIV